MTIFDSIMAQELNYIGQILSDAVSTRGRYYAHFHNVVVRFADDDTRADKDSLHFQDILKLLGLPRAKEVLLGRQTMWDWASAMKPLCDVLDKQDERKLIIFHYAGHAVLIGGDLHLVASLGSKHTLDFEMSFGPLYRNSAEFTNADVIIILDCCFRGAATRAIGQDERSVEIIAAVGSSQEAFRNASNQIRLQQKTFTSSLADEVARVVGNPAKSSVAFAEIISFMRAVSNPDRLPEYRLRRGTIGIRLGIPEKSRSAVQQYYRQKGGNSGTASPDQQAQHPYHRV